MSRTLPALLALGLAVGCADPSDTAPSDNNDNNDNNQDSAHQESDWGFDVGQSAPDFTLPNAEGETVSLSDYQGGRVAVIGTAAW